MRLEQIFSVHVWKKSIFKNSILCWLTDFLSLEFLFFCIVALLQICVFGTLTNVLSETWSLFISLFPPVCRTFPGVHRHDVSGSQPCGEKRLRVCPRGLENRRSLHVHQRLPEARAAGQSSAAASLPLTASSASLTSLLLLFLLLLLLQDLMISLILPDWLRTSSFFLTRLASMGHHAEVCREKKD